jgi:hypothetical protein
MTPETLVQTVKWRSTGGTALFWRRKGGGSQSEAKGLVNSRPGPVVRGGEGHLSSSAPHRAQRDSGGQVWAKEPSSRAAGKPAGSEEPEVPVRTRDVRTGPSCWLWSTPGRAGPCSLTPGEARSTHDATLEVRPLLYDRSHTRKQKPPGPGGRLAEARLSSPESGLEAGTGALYDHNGTSASAA